MIEMRSSWNGDHQYKLLLTAGFEIIKRLTVFFWTALQYVLNRRSNPWPYRSPAPKGEPPYKRTGNLAAGVLYEFDESGMEGRVGLLPQAKYGVPLEVSPRQDHAWMKPTLDKVMPQLRSIAEGGR